MTRMRPLLLVLAMVLAIAVSAAPARAQFNVYSWTISNSETDPFANVGPAGSGDVASFYLWFYCGAPDGMAAAQFDLEAVGIAPLAFTPTNGYLNAGGTTNLLLAVGGCPHGPVLAGAWLSIDLPGSLCLVPSATEGWNVTVDCSTDPLVWDNTTRGFSSVGDPCGSPVDALYCAAISVESESWGGIKGMYR